MGDEDFFSPEAVMSRIVALVEQGWGVHFRRHDGKTQAALAPRPDGRIIIGEGDTIADALDAALEMWEDLVEEGSS